MAWTWVSDVVCVAWTWVSHVVCVVTTWISHIVCVASVWIAHIVCVAWTPVVHAACRFSTWVVGGLMGGAIALGRLLCPVYTLLLAGSRRHLCESKVQTVSAVPRITAEAFSVAGVDSRFAYRDSGRRYDFRIESGRVEVSEDAGASWQLLSQEAISFDEMRLGVRSPAPRFDMVSASAGRVLAKEEGTDRLFFAILDPMFWHFSNAADPEGGIDGPAAAARAAELVVPSTYFKLDPEENIFGATNADLLVPLEGNFNAHPASERFHFFSTVLAAKGGLLDRFFHGMVVRVEPRLWHLIDTRPPPGKSRVPSGLPAYEQVAYCNSAGTQAWQCAIAFDRVLGIGAGHAHWHEQYDWTFGGEIQALNAKGVFDVPLLSYYQLFNGPIVDRDGFVDGTCNLYLLCRLTTPGDTASPCVPLPAKDAASAPPQQFALLFLDEQSLFSQRWRLAHPEDHEGLMFALAPDLYAKKNAYGFDLQKFWCPFKALAVTEESRLAVSRQVVVVNGRDPNSGRVELYSINFSWATSDHSWRWRAFPEGMTAMSLSDDDVQGASETVVVDSQTPDRIYPQTVRLREDTTLHCKGTSAGADGEIDIGRWFQKYLPADAQPVPALDQLGAPAAGQPPQKPGMGYEHPWQFLPEATFRRADRFSHFGVYRKADSRSQYYRVSIDRKDPSIDAAARWEDNTMQLAITRAKFDWEILSGGTGSMVGGATLSDLAASASAESSFAAMVWSLPTQSSRFQSSYNPGRVFLKLGWRGPLGWIATHWDKRDDELDAFDALPMTMTLHEGGTSQPGGARELPLMILAHVQVWSVPAVHEVEVVLHRENDRVTRAVVSFQSVFAQRLLLGMSGGVFDQAVWDQGSGGVWENLWQIHVGAVPQSGTIELLTLEVPTHFTLRPDSDGWFDGSWVPLTPAEADLMANYCSERGRMAHGTSVWFEDVVGHVSTAARTRFIDASR
ncbi:hypothetical protein LJR178_003940 [Variovorax sp. LjRoot178]